MGIRRRISVGVLLVGAILVTTGNAGQAAPSPAPVNGEHYLTATVNGQETKYLAPARSDKELQAQIDAHLKRAPGGKQINKNEISYNNGKFIMTFALPGQVEGTDPTREVNSAVVASTRCSTTWYCFFDGVNFTYPRGQLSDCGWQDLSDFGWSDRVESAAQNMHNWVQYRNHKTGETGHSNDPPLFWTDEITSRSDVSPYRNMADHATLVC